MYVYPCDLLGVGAIRVADNLRSTGLNGISLSASYHSGKFLRPHTHRKRLYFPEGGTVCFKPDVTRYRRLRSQLARAGETHDAFRDIERHAPDFSAAARTVGAHNKRLGYGAPEFTARSGNGDMLHNSLCPTQPQLTDVEQMTEAARGLRELRPSSFSFLNYGHMRLESLDWIRDALAL